jgi:hypothetical protein
MGFGGLSGKILLWGGICLALLTVTPARASDWKVDDTISALDGSRTYAATLDSIDTIRLAAGDEEHATLVVRCRSNYLETYIAWPVPVGKDALDMRWRADGGPPRPEVWSVSRDGGATFSEDARTFLANLRTVHRASFQLLLANFNTLQATFNVTGADVIVNTAASACRR